MSDNKKNIKKDKETYSKPLIEPISIENLDYLEEFEFSELLVYAS